ncbi:MAG: hypothetical protein RI988_2322 [Pseudomonadota bacterium]|jgi:GGDEF domain-containing protein
MGTQESETNLAALLATVGIGVAALDPHDRVTYSNAVFDKLVEIAPGAHRDICARAREAGRKVERLAFEPNVGWLSWMAEPGPGGLTVKVHRASAGERELARRADEASTDPYSGIPNRRALLLDVGRALALSSRVTLLLLEPRTTPGQLGLDVERMDSLSQQVAAAIQPRLQPGEALYRVSPIVLAITLPAAEATATWTRAMTLRQMARTASISPDDVPEGLDFIGGIASSVNNADATAMYQQACHAIATERGMGGMSCRWFAVT